MVIQSRAWEQGGSLEGGRSCRRSGGIHGRGEQKSKNLGFSAFYDITLNKMGQGDPAHYPVREKQVACTCPNLINRP